MLQHPIIGCYRILQDAIGCYRMLQDFIGCYIQYMISYIFLIGYILQDFLQNLIGFPIRFYKIIFITDFIDNIILLQYSYKMFCYCMIASKQETSYLSFFLQQYIVRFLDFYCPCCTILNVLTVPSSDEVIIVLLSLLEK